MTSNRVPARAAALIIMLAIPIVLLSATPAFAAYDSIRYPDWSVVSTLPGNIGETSPHGSYATTTVKCAVCHAVHNAASTSAYGSPELLLQSPVADACTYCHMNTASGYTQVYDGDYTKYSGTDYEEAHNDYDVGSVPQGVTCVVCHQVHAADNQMTSNAFLTQKLLVGDKTYTPFPQPNYDPVAQEPLSTDDKPTALTKWCAGCHFTLGVDHGYYNTSYDGDTHIMTTATASYANPAGNYTGQVAWQNSTYCMSCHSNQYGVSGRWPHYTNGVRFLDTADHASATATGAAVAKEDGVCLRCHRGDASSGIGIDY